MPSSERRTIPTERAAPPGSPAFSIKEKWRGLDVPACTADVEQSSVVTRSASDAMKSFLESDSNDDVASSFFLVKLYASRTLPQDGTAKEKAKPTTAQANVVGQPQVATTRSVLQLPMSPGGILPAFGDHARDIPRGDTLNRFVNDWRTEVARDPDPVSERTPQCILPCVPSSTPLSHTSDGTHNTPVD